MSNKSFSSSSSSSSLSSKVCATSKMIRFASGNMTRWISSLREGKPGAMRFWAKNEEFYDVLVTVWACWGRSCVHVCITSYYSWWVCELYHIEIVVWIFHSILRSWCPDRFEPIVSNRSEIASFNQQNVGNVFPFLSLISEHFYY